MRSLSITHVDSEATWRGGQQSLLTLALALRERGHAQTIVCPERSALAERAHAQGFAVLAKCPRAGDIIHAHSGQALNQVLRATLGASIIRVVTRHVAFTPKHPLVHRLKYTHTCHGIIAVSDAVSEVLVRSGVPVNRIQVIHTGIALPAFVARAEHDPFTIGHVGAFTHEKGQDVLIAAARALPHQRFLLAGDGPLRETLERSAPSNVHFPGFVSDLAAFFAQIDLFVMPSRSEAWGLAALEAMGHGVPVIASDIQGLAEIVTAECGWRVPVDDADALACAIEVAVPRASAMQETVRARAAQFTPQRMAEETENFYSRFL